MAAPNATGMTFPADLRSQLRVAKRNALLQGLPQTMLPSNEAENTPTDTLDRNFAPNRATLQDSEAYYRATRQQRLQRQIGQQVGLLTPQERNAIPVEEEYADTEEELQRGLEEQAAILNARQQGLDTRPRSAVREQLSNITQRATDEFVKKATERATKELSKLGLNTATGAAGATDGSSGVFLAAGFVLSGLWSLAGFVASIFLPENSLKTNNGQATSLAELRQQMTGQAVKQLADFLPRPGLTSAAKLIASFTLAYYAFISGFLLFLFLVVVAMLHQLLTADVATQAGIAAQSVWEWSRWPEMLDRVGL